MCLPRWFTTAVSTTSTTTFHKPSNLEIPGTDVKGRGLWHTEWPRWAASPPTRHHCNEQVQAERSELVWWRSGLTYCCANAATRCRRDRDVAARSISTCPQRWAHAICNYTSDLTCKSDCTCTYCIHSSYYCIRLMPTVSHFRGILPCRDVHYSSKRSEFVVNQWSIVGWCWHRRDVKHCVEITSVVCHMKRASRHVSITARTYHLTMVYAQYLSFGNC